MKKSNNKTWKRVAAGALSLALVAGAMPANVGGLLTGGKGIVAHAEGEIWVLEKAEDHDLPENENYTADFSAEGNTATFSNIRAHLRSANESIGRPGGRVFVGVKITRPEGITGQIEYKAGENWYTLLGADDDVEYWWPSFTPGEVETALGEAGDDKGIITKKLTIRYGEPTIATDITVKINVNNITILPEDINNGFVGVENYDVPILKAVNGGLELLDADYTAPTAVADLAYTGEPMALLSGGTWADSENPKGTFEYALGKVITSDIDFDDLAVNDILKIGDGGRLAISSINSIVLSGDTYQSNENNKITIFDDDYLYINNTDTYYTGGRGAALEVTGIDREQGIVYVQQVDENADLNWSEGVPSVTDAGDYCVSWRIVGDGLYNDVAPQTIKATIAKGALAEKHLDAETNKEVGDYVAPTAAKTLKKAADEQAGTPAEYYDDLFYTGENQALINAGSVDNGKGTMQYSKYICGDIDIADLSEGDLLFDATGNGFNLKGIDIFHCNAYSYKNDDIREADYRAFSNKTFTIKGNALSAAYDGNSMSKQFTNEPEELLGFRVTGVNTANKSVSVTPIFDLDDANWSTSVPTATAASKYGVFWRITGNDNYKPVYSAIGNEIKLKTAPVLLSNLDGAVITKADGKVLAANETGNYTVTGGKYYLYTDKTVAGADTTSSIAKLVGKNQTLATTTSTTTYVNKYEFTIPTLPADNGYTFSHTNNWSGSVPKSNESQLYVADGDVDVTDPSQLAAVLQSTGTFYYGDQPSKANVVINDGFGNIVLVEDVYLSNDQGTKLDLTSGNVAYGNYKLTAKVTIDSDGDGNLETGTLKTCTLYADVVYAARPMSENKYYLVTANPDFDATQAESETNKKTIETPLEVVEDKDKTTGAPLGTYSVIVPDDTFTYNGTAQKPEIVVKNGGNNAELTVVTDYTSNVAEKTDAGDYTFELVAPVDSANKPTGNYADKVTVKWSIAQATANINVVPKNDIVYDGAVLDKSDFTFTAKDAASQQVIAEMTAQGETAAKTDITIEPRIGNLYYNGGVNKHLIDDVFGLMPLISYPDKGYSLNRGTDNGANIIDFEDFEDDSYIQLPGMDPVKYSELDIRSSTTPTVNARNSFSIAKDGVLTYYTRDLEEETGYVYEHTAQLTDSAKKDWFVTKEQQVIDNTETTVYKIVEGDIWYFNLMSAGLQKANITITNPNFKDITINDVVAKINKRKVAITPAETNNKTFGYEDDIANGIILKNSLTGTFETAEYVVDETTNQPTEALAGKTGFIASDYARLGDIPEANLATMFLTIGKEKETTNVLNPDENNRFNFDTFVNDAGTYEYEIRSTEEIIAQIDEWIANIQNSGQGEETIAQQLSYIEPFKTAITNLMSDYEVVLEKDSLFTLEKAPLTNDMFTVNYEGAEYQDVNGNGVPTYTFDGSEKFAPSFDFDNGEFSNTDKTPKLTRGDFDLGGYISATLPGPYQLEFAAVANSNYTGEAFIDWAIAANEGYTASLNSMSKTYDGKAVEPSITYRNNGRTVRDLPQGLKTTYTYYKTPEDASGNITVETIKTWDDKYKLAEAPKDAGDYYVVASTTYKGYNIPDVYRHVHIARVRVNITPSVTSKEFGEPDPTISFTTDIGDKVVEGDAVSLNNTDLLTIGGYEDEAGNTVDYDGSVGNKWTIQLGELALNNPNYTFNLTTNNFTVTPKLLTDDNIKVTKVCVTDQDGWAHPQECVKVVANLYNADEKKYEEVELVKDVDFEFTSAARTKQNNDFSVQIKGTGNYSGNAEAKVDVIGDVNAETADVSKLYSFTESAPDIAIHPTMHVIGSKVRWDCENKSEDVTIEEYGIIFNRDGAVNNISELTYEASSTDKKASIVRIEGVNGQNIIDLGKGVIAVGYVKLKDKAGNTFFAYSDNIGGKTYVCTEIQTKAVSSGDKHGIKVQFEGNIHNKDYSVKEYGFIYSRKEGREVKDLTIDNVDKYDDIYRIKNANGQNFADDGTGVVVVGYMIVCDKAGNEAYVYTNNLGGKYTDFLN